MRRDLRPAPHPQLAAVFYPSGRSGGATCTCAQYLRVLSQRLRFLIQIPLDPVSRWFVHRIENKNDWKMSVFSFVIASSIK